MARILCPEFTLRSHAQPSPGLHRHTPVPGLLPCWFHVEPHCSDSLSPAATSPLPCPELWSTAPLRTTVHCRCLPLHRALLCPCWTTRPKPWFIPWRPSLQAQGQVQYPRERRCRNLQGCRGSLFGPGCRVTTYIGPSCYTGRASGF